MENRDDQAYHRKRVIETLPENRKAIKTIGWEKIIKKLDVEYKTKDDSKLVSYKPIGELIKLTFEDICYKDMFHDYYSRHRIIRKLFRLLNNIFPGSYHANAVLNIFSEDTHYFFSTKLTRRSLNKTLKIINTYSKALHAGYVDKIRKAKEDLNGVLYGK